MSRLGDERRRFGKMQTALGAAATALGYEYAWGRVEACEECPNVHPKSTHKVGLGADLHLYIGGRYIRDGEGHSVLHDIWSLMGGAEVIVFSNGGTDWNHYSIEWNGVR